MTRHYHLQKGYQCPECGADVEAAGGPDHMSAWRCKSLTCDWERVFDTYENPKDELNKREKFK